MPLATRRTGPPAGRASLYDTDLHAWAMEQAALIRRLAPDGLDVENVAEEIESVGRSQKSEIRRRMIRLLAHLLKWQHQPDRRSNSWLSTIGGQRRGVVVLIEDSPSLRSFVPEAMTWAYSHARRDAAVETGRPLGTFPADCPYGLTEVLEPTFLPGPPFDPADLDRD